MWVARFSLVLWLSASATPSGAAARDDPPPAAADCASAATEAERAWALPEHLLLAIGLAETGQRDPATSRLRPMPYSINVAGTDVVFASAPYAVGAVAALRDRGVGSIDVGCFQVNLHYHPGAFATLPEAFDPRANAHYAAGFLRQLYEQAGSWEGAVAAYHSADPARGIRYRDRVLRFWRDLGARPGVSASVAARLADPHVIRLSARAAAIPVYTLATLPPALRAAVAALIRP